MTDKDYSPHETWCDTQNNISVWCNCMVSTYIEEIDSLKLAMQEIRECIGADPKQERGGALKAKVLQIREITKRFSED